MQKSYIQVFPKREKETKHFCKNYSLPLTFHCKKYSAYILFRSSKTQAECSWSGHQPALSVSLAAGEKWYIAQDQPGHASPDCCSMPQPAGERELLPHHRHAGQPQLSSHAQSSEDGRWEKLGCHNDLSAKWPIKSQRYSPLKPMVFFRKHCE